MANFVGIVISKRSSGRISGHKVKPLKSKINTNTSLSASIVALKASKKHTPVVLVKLRTSVRIPSCSSER